ncbi:MAG: ATP synthase F1 subunit epsilon [Bacteroidota bacterium]
MYLEIITPEEKKYTGNISLIQVPGSEGLFEVLHNHAPIISTLENGKIKIITEDEKTIKFVLTGGGIIEVNNNNIIVLAESLKEAG